jgi:hypothetical protein
MVHLKQVAGNPGAQPGSQEKCLEVLISGYWLESFGWDMVLEAVSRMPEL